MNVNIEIYGEPVGKGRPRFNGCGKYVRTYTPDKTVRYEKLVKSAYKEQAENYSFGDAPLRVNITAFFAPPKSATKAKRAKMLNGELYPTKKPDADNIAKIICDALNGIAYNDDSQIVRLTVNKIYSETAYVTVDISEYK